MSTEAQPARSWGWEDWARENVTGFLRLDDPSLPDLRLCLLIGPDESCRNDLLDYLGRFLRDDPASVQQGRVEDLSRDRRETLSEWQSRLAISLSEKRVAADPVPAKTLSRESGASHPPMPVGPAITTATAEAPVLAGGRVGFWLVPDGDRIPSNWWRQQLERWLTRNPSGCLVLSLAQPNDALLTAFRQSGGSVRGLLQRHLGPWDISKIQKWRELFVPAEARSGKELLEYSHGGWPGPLWLLYEEHERRAKGIEGTQVVSRMVEGFTAERRHLLFATALAPAPHRDFAEMILGREIDGLEWRLAVKQWKHCEFVSQDGGWTTAKLPKVLQNACEKLGESTHSVNALRGAALQQLFRLVPSEESRRLLLPLANFLHVDREGLNGAFREEGTAIWETLEAHPGLCSSGVGPQPLARELRKSLESAYKWMPWLSDPTLPGRLKALWAEREKGLAVQVAEFEEREAALQKRLEECSQSVRRIEKELLRAAKRETARRRKQRSRGQEGRHLSVRAEEGLRQLGGSLCILGGVAWICIGFLQAGTFDTVTMMGGFSFILAGFGLVLGGGKESGRGGAARRSRLEEAEKSLRQAEGGGQPALILAREQQLEVTREHEAVKRDLELYRSALHRPYVKI